MEWLIDLVASTSFGGKIAAVVAILAVVQNFKKSEWAATKEVLAGLKDVVTNIPRRWKSEQARIGTKFQDAMQRGLDDQAAVKALGKEAKAVVRVFAGTIEDVLSKSIDLLVIVVPFSVTIAKKAMKLR